tara:strand:- start:3530 stop:3910 length:381 start_codon:yes stop_codon:yes gene_type:complete
MLIIPTPSFSHTMASDTLPRSVQDLLNVFALLSAARSAKRVRELLDDLVEDGTIASYAGIIDRIRHTIKSKYAHVLKPYVIRIESIGIWKGCVGVDISIKLESPVSTSIWDEELLRLQVQERKCGM